HDRRRPGTSARHDVRHGAQLRLRPPPGLPRRHRDRRRPGSDRTQSVHSADSARPRRQPGRIGIAATPPSQGGSVTTVFITGGHSGIGLECSRQLAARGVDLVLAGRSPAKMQTVAEELRAAHGIDVATVELDTSSLASVRTAAATYSSLIERGEAAPLQGLICNAGGRFDGKDKYSPDGYELTFATNCLGHFLLVELLIPAISADGRIVFTASGTHDPATMDGKLVGAAVEPNATVLADDGLNGAKPLPAGKRYSTSKLCTVMYAYELARRLDRAGSGISSIAYDPGSVPETGFLRDMPKAVQRLATSSLMKSISTCI